MLKPFEVIEALTYQILAWLIILPRTIIKLVLDPGFVPAYVKKELKREAGSQFNKYMSPISLFLFVALIPGVAISFIPSFGVHFILPSGDLITGRSIHLETQALFKSDTWSSIPEFEWTIWECGNRDEFGFCQYDKYIASWKDNFSDGIFIGRGLTNSHGQQIDYLSTYTETNIQVIGHTTAKDFFDYSFNSPGDYALGVVARIFPTTQGAKAIEQYSSYIFLHVPENTDFPVRLLTSPKDRDSQVSEKDFVQRLQSNEAIFLGLALLFLPLVFALASITSTRRPISQTVLKEALFEQCYYFAPLLLVFWLSLYLNIYYTEEIKISQKLLWFPFLITFLQFANIEANAIAQRQRTNKWVGFLNLLGCLAVLAGIFGLMASFQEEPVMGRRIIAWAFLVGSSTLVALLIRRTVINRVKSKSTKQGSS